ncbi:MAG: hypothetical protein HGB19_03330 [Chlorobiales bacterium]|nr:hypothetical protein [Chlorobiales bacterium]
MPDAGIGRLEMTSFLSIFADEKAVKKISVLNTSDTVFFILRYKRDSVAVLP